MKITGAWTAIVTPMNPDHSVDYNGLARNVEFQMSEGIDGLVPVGTTGESPTLDWDEHNDVIDRVIALCGDRCGVLAGTGSNSTEEAVESTRHAVRSGAKAALLVDCYYNGPSSQELRDEYYAVVAAEFPQTAIVPYVIPGRSGTVLGVEDLAILAAKFPNVRTVKEATGDLARMARTRAVLGDDFSIMSGDDDLTFKMMSDPAIRAQGVISVASNVIPGSIRKMVNLARSGDMDGAEKLRASLDPLLGIVTVKVDNERVLPSGERVIVNDRYRNPLAIKTLMAGLGMPSGPGRRPLGRMSPTGVEVVRCAAKKVRQTAPDVLEPIAGFYGIDIDSRLADDSVWAALSS